MLRSPREWNIYKECCQPGPESCVAGRRRSFQPMGTFKALGGFAVLIFVVVALFQVLPPIMANFSFSDDLRQVAMMAGANPQKTDDDVRNDVLKKAREHDLPI